MGVFVGSEGLLGIVTEVVVRILRTPEATRTVFRRTFPSTDEAAGAVAAIVAAGIVPAAIEMCDQLAIEAIVKATGVDWPLDAGAVLLMDVDGVTAEVERTADAAIAAMRACGALEIRAPRDDAERLLMWKGRKSAFAAVGRTFAELLRPGTASSRGRKIALVLREIAALGREAGLRIANVFHAGDEFCTRWCSTMARRGAGRKSRGRAAIPRACATAWSIGEHGVGRDKACYLGEQFSPDDSATMLFVRASRSIPTASSTPTKCFDAALARRWPGPYVPHVPRSSAAVRRAAAERDDRSGMTFAGVAPKTVIEPRTRDELAATVRDLYASDTAFAFIGGGTERELGNPPSALDTIVRTTALDRVIEYAPEDQTITVEGGMTLEALDRVLEEHGQMFPIDVGDRERATVGGAIATNAFGARRHRYGSLRDMIVGVELVRPDGTRVRGGGRVVKNVAGFDLPKLSVGSLGTLGAIVSATLRVHPRPASSTMLVVRNLRRNIEEGDALTAAVLAAQLEPMALGAAPHRRRRSRLRALQAEGRPAAGGLRKSSARLALAAQISEQRDGRDAERSRGVLGVRARRTPARRVARACTHGAGVGPSRARHRGPRLERRAARCVLSGAGDFLRQRRRRRPLDRRRHRDGAHHAARSPRRGDLPRDAAALARVRRRVGRAAAVVSVDAGAQDSTSIRRAWCNPGRFVGGLDDGTFTARADLIGDCVHCGFCLPACPTYVSWGEEMDSPRGRIDLMKAVSDRRPARSMRSVRSKHFDACLGCMACVTACPSGVRYDLLIESTRASVESGRTAAACRRCVPQPDLRALPVSRAAAHVGVSARRLRRERAAAPDPPQWIAAAFAQAPGRARRFAPCRSTRR